MKLLRLRILSAIAITSFAFLLPFTGHAWNRYSSWCRSSDIGWCRVDDSFNARGADPTAWSADINVAAAWWLDVQANLNLTSSSYATYNDHSDHDPGEVVAVCNGDGTGPFALTHWNIGYHPTCDLWNTHVDSWHMRIVTNIVDGEACNSTQGWALTRSDLVQNKTMLYRVASHEFGHVLGLSHSSEPRALMNGPLPPNQTRLMNDDYAGLRSWDFVIARGMYTTRATFDSPYAGLNFSSTVQNSNVPVLYGPAIAGNPAANSQGWDYAVAWVNLNNQVVVATAKDNSSSNLAFLRTTTTSETTLAPVSVAVSPEGRIGVAWTGDDYYRTVNFMISADGGVTWSKGTFWGYWALGGVEVAYTPGHWLLTWAWDSDDNSLMTEIITSASSDSAGMNWPGPFYIYGDRLAMQTNRPAVACGDNPYNLCVMAFSDFSSAAKPLATQGIYYSGNGFQLTGLANAIPWAVTYHNPNMVFVPAYGSRPATYFTLWSQWSVSPANLTYALRYQSEGEAGVFHNWTDKAMSPQSRGGYAAAYNYRTRALRFIWRSP